MAVVGGLFEVDRLDPARPHGFANFRVGPDGGVERRPSTLRAD